MKPQHATRLSILLLGNHANLKSAKAIVQILHQWELHVIRASLEDSTGRVEMTRRAKAPKKKKVGPARG